MRPLFRHGVTRRLQRIGWVYLTRTGKLRRVSDLQIAEPSLRTRFLPITKDNYARVAEFRERGRVAEYGEKLAGGEIGFFAECAGIAAGSVWATINRSPAPVVVRGYMRLMPNEALIHDVVTGERSRGMGVARFMVASLGTALFEQYGACQIIVDVNVRNGTSLRVMQKAGFPMRETVLSLSAFGHLVFQKTIGPHGNGNS